MTVRVAVVGCGQWGRNHVRTLKAIGALAAVADRDEAKAASIGAEFGVPGLSPDAAIAAREIDALVLALPAAVHGPMARRAFAAGKDVLIEKPIALDPADAALSRRAAGENNRILMVGHVLRFHPAFERLAALVSAGRIGALRHVASVRFGFGRFPPMDVVWDLAPHDLSLALHLAGGAPETASAHRRAVFSDAADAAEIALGFANGVTAAIHLSRVSPYRDRRFTAIGTAGALCFDGLAPGSRALTFHATRAREDAGGLVPVEGEAEIVSVDDASPLERELRHFIDCVERRRDPETGAGEAVENVRLLAALSPR